MGEYNPIVRTFNQIRAAVLEATDVPRRLVRPGAVIEELIPLDRRHAVWDGLRRRGLAPPWMDWPPVGPWVGAGLVAASVPLLECLGPCAALLVSAVGLGVAYVSTRRWPSTVLTVGELTVYCTRFPDHKASGYRWARGDIALKVRLIIAENLGVPLDRIREDTSFVEDLGAD